MREQSRRGAARRRSAGLRAKHERQHESSSADHVESQPVWRSSNRNRPATPASGASTPGVRKLVRPGTRSHRGRALISPLRGTRSRAAPRYAAGPVPEGRHVVRGACGVALAPTSLVPRRLFGRTSTARCVRRAGSRHRRRHPCSPRCSRSADAPRVVRDGWLQRRARRGCTTSTRRAHVTSCEAGLDECGNCKLCS